MPSQHDYLVNEELREELRRREPSAEGKLAQRFNRGRRPESRLQVPPPGSDYGRYDNRLLALLWALAGNAVALRVLARPYGWTDSDPPAYADMPDALLAFLWTWGRDALALERLWTRGGRLPLARIDEETPDAVLGFLWWRERRPDARDELFRRYHLGGASDAAQDRALTLLLVVDRWDYERYPALDHLMNVSAAHHRIDGRRHSARAPWTDPHQTENAAVLQSRPETSVEERDFLETNVPLEHSLACGFVGEAEAEASDDGGEGGAEGGDEQKQVEQSGDGDASSVAFPREYLVQGGMSDKADKRGRNGRIMLAHGKASYLSCFQT